MTPDLEAVAIGADVPPGLLPVTVHSVFRGALNLQPGDGGGLITVIADPALDHPRCIRLGAPQDFTVLGLRPLAAGRLAPEQLLLERAGAPPLRIGCLRAARRRPRPLPAIRRDAPWQAAAALLAAMQAQAGTDLRLAPLLDPDGAQGAQPGDRAQGLLGQRLGSAALALGQAVRAGGRDPAREAAAALVGLGGGLTPSGDDFLCGFLAAARCRPDPGRLPLRAALESAVLGRLGATNAISATLLRCAAEGKVARALDALARAIQAGRDPGPALAGLCAFGHSSGMDTATGFLYGLGVW
jgi:hypothetical protein